MPFTYNLKMENYFVCTNYNTKQTKRRKIERPKLIPKDAAINRRVFKILIIQNDSNRLGHCSPACTMYISKCNALF